MTDFSDLLRTRRELAEASRQMLARRASYAESRDFLNNRISLLLAAFNDLDEANHAPWYRARLADLGTQFK